MRNDSLQSYMSKLDSKFKKNSKVPLRKVIEQSKRGSIIPLGTLVLMPFVNGEIRLKILETDTPDKGFSIPLRISEEGAKQNVSPNYLGWYLRHDFVKEYLLLFVQGSVFPRIPKAKLFELLIPLPTYKREFTNPIEASILKTENPFRELINNFYGDYLVNFKQKRFTTAIILAGAISEAILYQLLLENEVDYKILEDDRTLGLGKLITYVQLLKLDKKLDFPLTHFIELQKHRNSAIHVGLAVKKKVSFAQGDLNCFDQIIKSFGI